MYKIGETYIEHLTIWSKKKNFLKNIAEKMKTLRKVS